VNTAGTAAQGGYPLMAAYSVSKWGVVSLTKTLAKEVGQYNIFVNAVVPGAIEGERIQRSIRQRAEVLKINAAEEEKAHQLELEKPPVTQGLFSTFFYPTQALIGDDKK
jgi:NAD(P)-dependent dehydrogenase (short-subunit alcohol dehydrogenase family)